MIASTAATTPITRSPAWYRPTISPEHGVYVVLLVSCLCGVAAAQAWHGQTTLALVAAMAGFQAEHPWIVQIRQRKSPKPRLLLWGSLYSFIAMGSVIYLGWQEPTGRLPLLIMVLGAMVAFAVDAIAVWRRAQRAIANEMVTFAAVCLSGPLAYVATTGSLTPMVLGLWGLNALFFSSSIFTLKWRKSKTRDGWPSVLFHSVALLLLAGMVGIDWLSLWSASAFGVALLKWGIVLWQRQWYCSSPIQAIAMLETGMALVFLMVVALSVLPVRWVG